MNYFFNFFGRKIINLGYFQRNYNFEVMFLIGKLLKEVLI